jgi:predicted secreted protein
MGATAACVLAWGTTAATAQMSSTTTTTSQTQAIHVTASPNAQATVPVTISASGQVGLTSTIAIFAQPGAAGCAAQAADEPARGGTLIDRRTVSGMFSYTATFTPATAGTYAICTYADGSVSGQVEHQSQSFEISVAPAPPAPTTQPQPVAPAVRPGAACVVPSLRRHTLRGAIHFLAVGNCKLGRVYRPSAASLRAARRRAGGRTPTEVVVSQTPAAGSVHVGGYTVAVRLGFGPAPRTSKTRPTP